MKRIFYILPFIFLLLSCKNGFKNSFKNALVIDIKGISFDKKETLVFGNNQDIIISGLPDSALNISFSEEKNAFNWELKKPVYFKINGITQNLFLLDSISTIIISGKPYPIQDILNNTESFFKNRKGKTYIELISSFFKGRKGNTYIKLSNLIKRDSQESLIVIDKDDKKILINLDTNVALINKSGKLLSLNTTGTIDNSKEIKIEFFKTINGVLFDSNKDNGTTYSTTVKPLYTPFGASEITIVANNKLDVLFNKHFREVIPNFVIDSALVRNDFNLVNIKQKVFANTYDNDIYTINFSNKNSHPIGTIDDSLNFKPNANNKLLNETNLKYFKINENTFIFSIIPLIIIFGFGICIFFIFFKSIYEIDNRIDKNKWSWYFFILFIILFFLSIGRIFIGYNLAFTAPYFTFAFPTSIIIAPFLMLNVLLVWLIFFKFADYEKINLKVVWFILIFVIIICFFYFKYNFPFYLEELKKTIFFNEEWNWNKLNYKHTIFFLISINITLSLLLLFFKKIKEIKFFKKIKEIKFFYILYFLLLILFAAIFKNGYSIFLLLFVISCIILSQKFEFPKRFILINPEVKWWVRIFYLLILLIPIIVVSIIAIFFKKDTGYIINIFLFLIILILIYLVVYKYNKPNIHDYFERKITFSLGLIILVIIIISLISLICIRLYFINLNYDPLENNRSSNRITSYLDFEKVHEYGTRESEKHAQFFAELGKYSYPSQNNLYEPIHPGIASFYDPVVKNDLSVPFGLIYPFGSIWWVPVVLLLAIWFIILFMVFNTTIKPFEDTNNELHFTLYSIIRIYCACMIVGSGLWLLASYYNIVPFTGRLIFGLGQDSIAEVFETIILFSCMGLIGKVK